jgi:hypothetical protein
MPIGTNDGSLIFDTKVDDTGLIKGSSKISKNLNKTYGGLEKSFTRVEKKLGTTVSKLDEVHAKIIQLQAEAESKVDFLPGNNEELVNSILEKNKEYQKLIDKDISLGNLYADQNSEVSMIKDKMIQIKKQMTEQTSLANRLKEGFGGVTQQVTAMAGKMIIFMIIKQIIQWIIEGIQNLAQFSSKTNESISKIQSSFMTMKNALAAAFEPILQALAPVLVIIIDLITWLLNQLTKLTTLIFTTNGSFIQAKKVNVDYAKSLNKTNKELKKTTASFDELEILTNKTNENLENTPQPEDMFEEVAFTGPFAAFQDWRRQLGGKVAEWWVEDVSPWFTKERWSNVWEIVKAGWSIGWSRIRVWWQNSTLGKWWDESVTPWFTKERWTNIWDNAKTGWSIGWGKTKEFFMEKLPQWWENDVKPWFTAERWQQVWTGVKDGWNNGWNNLSYWWKTATVSKWWNEDVIPFFSIENWQGLWNNAKIGFANGWAAIGSWWKSTAIGTWWNDNVAPWFSVKKWTDILSNVQTAFSDMWKKIGQNILDVIGRAINGIIDMINKIYIKAPEWLGGWSWSPNIQPFKVPQLATGTVVPANYGNFLAMLGDNKREPEIVSPQSTIEDAVRNVIKDQEIRLIFEGNMAELVRILNPQIKRENSRIGGTTRRLTTGGAY